MDIRLLPIIIVPIIAQIVAIENRTATDRTNSGAKNNFTIQPRRSGYGLIKFEGQANPFQGDNSNPAGVVTFEDQPTHRPFRFENDQLASTQNFRHEISKRPIDVQEFDGQNPGYNPDLNSQGYGIYNPEVFGNQDLNTGISDPEGHAGFIKPNPTVNTNIAEAQSGSGYGLFEDDNNIDNQVNPGQKRKRRRRRRKPKQLPGPGYGFALPGAGNPGFRPGALHPSPIPSGQPYRVPRLPRPSIAGEALNSITNALTSIARYDDLQCVPRLLCEVAGGQNPGAGSNGASGILQSIVNLQPLVTLLAAYNGISTSPLFVFGRAALLGMTSKGNTGTCRYAYSQCPTDPEKLVEYLNNHNGGFFRFFSNPQPYGQQNLEQFYSHLSGNYGIYQPQGNQEQNGYPSQNFGSYPNPNVGGVGGDQYEGPVYTGQNHHYGLHNPGYYGGQYPHQNLAPHRYGIPNHTAGQSSLYHDNQQKYGFGYPYQPGQYKNAAVSGVDKSKIEKRIQNRPDLVYVDNGKTIHKDVKWSFLNPNSNDIAKAKQRFGRTVVFPGKAETTQFYEESSTEISYDKPNMDPNRKAKGFQFPEVQSNRQYIDYYDYPPYTRILDHNNFKLDKQGFYVESSKEPDYYTHTNKENREINEDGVQLVYVLRGNTDPNKPEIIKLRPGQEVM